MTVSILAACMCGVNESSAKCRFGRQKVSNNALNTAIRSAELCKTLLIVRMMTGDGIGNNV